MSSHQQHCALPTHTLLELLDRDVTSLKQQRRRLERLRDRVRRAQVLAPTLGVKEVQGTSGQPGPR